MDPSCVIRRRWALYPSLSVCDGIITWYAAGLAFAIPWLRHAVESRSWDAVARLVFPPASFFECFVVGAICAPGLIYFLDHLRGKKPLSFAIISVLAGVTFGVLISGVCSASLGIWDNISAIYGSPEKTVLEKANLFLGMLMWMSALAYTQVIFISFPKVILVGGGIGGLLNGLLVRKILPQTAETEDYGLIKPILRLISLFMFLATFIAFAMLVKFSLMSSYDRLIGWRIFELWTLLGWVLVLIGGPFAAVQLWRLKPSGRTVTIIILANAAIYYTFSSYLSGTIRTAAPMVLSFLLLLVASSRSAKDACSSREHSTN